MTPTIGIFPFFGVSNRKIGRNLMKSPQAFKEKNVIDYNANDVKFAQEMIPHHELALEMVSAYYGKAKNPEIKDIALRIQLGQKAEIDMFRSWLAARGQVQPRPMKM